MTKMLSDNIAVHPLKVRQLLQLEQKSLVALTGGADKGDFLPMPPKTKISTQLPTVAWLPPPSEQIARAWRLWCDTLDNQPEALNVANLPIPRRTQMAFIAGGGVGDILQTTAVLHDLARRFDADITYVTTSRSARAILKNNRDVGNIIIAPFNEHDFARDCLALLPIFDLLISFKYSIDYLLPPQSGLTQADLRRNLAPGWKSATPYALYNRYYWPELNNAFGRAMQRRGHSILDTAGYSGGLAVSSDTPLHFYPDPADGSTLVPLLETPYITVHHGIDPANNPSVVRKQGYNSTKNLPLSTWRELVNSLTASGYCVVQVGIESEDLIPGVSIDLRGQTSISETGLVLKHALCHVDTEGGLVHLARAVNTRSVVMFGPTPSALFGYAANINLQSTVCADCWWTTRDWVRQCPRLTDGPECMLEHTARKIITAINVLLSERDSNLPPINHHSFPEATESLPSAPRGLPAPRNPAHIDTQIAELERQIFSREVAEYRLLRRRDRVNILIERQKSEINTGREGWFHIKKGDGDDIRVQSILYKGWHELESWGCWGEGALHHLLMIVPGYDSDIEFELDFMIHCIGPERPNTVFFTVNGTEIACWHITSSTQHRSCIVPAHLIPRSGRLDVILKLDHYIVPSLDGLHPADSRRLGLGLKALRYRYVMDGASRHPRRAAVINDVLAAPRWRYIKRALRRLLARLV